VADPDWKDAELFDAEDVELISFEGPEEALEYLAGNGVPRPMPDGEFAAWLRETEAEVTVVGYRRASLNHSAIRGAASWAARYAVEGLGEEGMTDPEDDLRILELDLERSFLATIVRVLREHDGPWHCEEVARHTYDAEEIIAVLGLEDGGG